LRDFLFWSAIIMQHNDECIVQMLAPFSSF